MHQALRAALDRLDGTVPGKFEISVEGIVHELTAPNSPHELTVASLRKRLEQPLPDNLGTGGDQKGLRRPGRSAGREGLGAHTSEPTGIP